MYVHKIFIKYTVGAYLDVCSSVCLFAPLYMINMLVFAPMINASAVSQHVPSCRNSFVTGKHAYIYAETRQDLAEDYDRWVVGPPGKSLRDFIESRDWTFIGSIHRVFTM